MDSKHVSKSQFKAKALEFFRDVEKTGQPIIVTDNGRPKIEVRPYREANDDPLKALRGSVLSYTDPDDPVDVDDWEVLK